MIKMETRPNQTWDLRYTQIQEVGREGVYYVDMGTYDVRREVDVIDFPRGGIL